MENNNKIEITSDAYDTYETSTNNNNENSDNISDILKLDAQTTEGDSNKLEFLVDLTKNSTENNTTGDLIDLSKPSVKISQEDNIINNGNSTPLNTINDSGNNKRHKTPINIPNFNSNVKQSISSDEMKPYKLSVNDLKDTLSEPIIHTLLRDLYDIYTRLKYVINPFIPENKRSAHIKQWDLWGPLLFNILLAITLAFQNEQKANTFILVFIIFWIGSLLVYINAKLLDVKLSLFQTYCLLGYSLFPLNISSLLLSLFHIHEILRFALVLLCCVWSCYSMSGFLKSSSPEEQRLLVLYPGLLLYLFISGVIVMTRK